ncbi:MAG TPA: glycoside hydrolase family 2 TIM barrel-domain containing protein, partial [Verrucomicrobiae bacterium]|nr:glycoside hydrolase family 2 TIM barrel-domain containing protein [Verrucomicrobiae bacterium]
AENSPALKPAPDKGMGATLVLKVNGRRIECLGGDWGMDDAMKRISRERLEPYIRMEHDAHLNMIRNWAGQSTSETFYDLCDQYGILVWNDFWMNTETHDYRPVDHALFLTNVADSLKQYRNHPSIALWCAGNECVPPEDLNEGMDRLVYELDGTRYYQPDSRLVNLNNSGPWSNLPLESYFTNLNKGFTTELGASSIPSAEVLRTMMPEADLWPTGDQWAYHDLHSQGEGGRSSTFGRITSRFGEPKNVEDLSRKAQMMNYETYRAIYEGFNSRLWDSCSGVLVWMSHPSWPSMIWQFYTWDYDPNASLFGAMKGAEPVHIQMNLPGCDVAVVNRQSAPLERVTASATIYDLSGKAVQSRKVALDAAPDACTPALTLDWPATGAYLARLELRDKHGKLLSENFYWHARNESQLQQLSTLPKVAVNGKTRVKRNAKGIAVEVKVTNPSDTPALQIRLTLRDAKTGQRVLPVYYEDNYFSLLPGESRVVQIEAPGATQAVHVSTEGWNIEPASF